MAREVIQYKLTLDKRYLNKEGGMTQVGNSLQCNFKDDTELMNPTLILSNFDINAVNYFYIPTLKRYYYVVPDGVTFSKPYYYVKLHVDVLMSFKEDINKTEVIADRSKSLWDMYIQDDELIIDQYTCDRIISFNSSPFSDDSAHYILALLGS